MNKFLFVFGMTFGGAFGALLRGPFVPLFVYFFWAVLKPQYLWQFQLSPYPDPGWALVCAASALVSYLPWVFGVIGAGDPLRRVFPRFVWPHRMMLGLFVWQTLSYLNANDQYRAYPFYYDFLVISVIYLLSTQVIRSFAQIHLLYLALTVPILYIAIEVVQIYLTSGYLVLYKRGFAGLDNNGAALLVAMGIPLSYFAWEFTRGWYRWGFLLVIPVLIEAVLSSYSRGAMLSSIVGAFFMFLYSRNKKFLFVCYAAVAVGVPIVAGEAIQERFATVFQDQKEKADGSFQSRLDSWNAARLIANAYPVFGAGIRCSNLLTKEYGADLEGRTIHNQYLQVAADSGWVGLLWYLALIGTAMWAMWSARRRLWRETDPESVRIVGVLGGLESSLWVFLFGVIFLSLEMFEPPYLVLLLGVQVWAVATAEVTAPAPQRRRPTFAPRPRPNPGRRQPFTPPPTREAGA